MRFNPQVHTHEIPQLLECFLSIIGPDPWLKRYRSLQDQIRSNILVAPFVKDRHSLELALGHLLELRHSGELSLEKLGPQHYIVVSFVAPVARIYEQLSDTGKHRLAGMLRDGLNTDTGLLPLRNEVETVTHLMLRGFDLLFLDIETGQGFDFLARKNGVELEVECKSVSGDLGRKIHRRRMVDLSRHLLPVVREALQRGSGGHLVQVVLPSRLHGQPKFLDQIAAAVDQALRRRVGMPGPEPCKVDVRTFELEGSPFASADPGNVHGESVSAFISQYLGPSNPHILVAYCPKRTAIVVAVQSRKPDRVLAGLMRDIKDAAKGQFTRSRPGILAVQFLELGPGDLLKLAAHDSADPARASALQIATNLFFRSPERAHLHTIVYRSHGLVRRSVAIREDAIEQTIQERGPTYSFKNPNHPFSADTRYSVFSV